MCYDLPVNIFFRGLRPNLILCTWYFIFLLQNHADPYIRNSRQESPLDLAAQYGRMETVSEMLQA